MLLHHLGPERPVPGARTGGRRPGVLQDPDRPEDQSVLERAGIPVGSQCRRDASDRPCGRGRDPIALLSRGGVVLGSRDRSTRFRTAWRVHGLRLPPGRRRPQADRGEYQRRRGLPECAAGQGATGLLRGSRDRPGQAKDRRFRFGGHAHVHSTSGNCRTGREFRGGSPSSTTGRRSNISIRSSCWLSASFRRTASTR